ncbi:DsbA family protein [Sulfurimonas sp.]
MIKKILSVGVAASIAASVCVAADSSLTKFDKKMIDAEKKMISANKRFAVDNIIIQKKKKIDNRWTMYVFNLHIQDKKTKQKTTSPMIIFTDGIYQTNSLMNLKTGKRYETDEKIRLEKERRAAKKREREQFEKSFVLNKKYYNKEHLIAGSMNAKNKIIMISDPLCVACIGAFPAIYNAVKNNKDFALFYYHFPLQGLHPTAMTISKAMEYAKEHGQKDVVKRVLFANLGKKYDVYKERDPKTALRAFNEVIGTDYTLAEIKDISIQDDMKIGQDVKLRGTPTIIFNGKLYKARENLSKALEKKE